MSAHSDLQQKTSYLPDIQRLLPQSPDAERGILSSILITPKLIIPLCRAKRLTADHFHIPAHGIIYETMLAMEDARKEIDVITLTERLRNEGKLEYVGGPATVTELLTYLPTSANAAFYVEIAKEKRTLRDLIRICSEYAARAYEEQDQVAALLEGVMAAIEALISEHFTDGDEGCVTGEAIAKTWQRFDQRLLDDADGVTTGIVKWDEALGGLRNGRMIVIGARPALGKTALAESMAAHITKKGHRVIFFQRDMPVPDMISRIACREAGEVFEDFDRANLTESRMANVRRALSAIDRERLRVYCPAQLTPEYMRATFAKEMRHGGVSAVFIDVFQRITARERKGLTATDILSDASKSIRDMSIEYNVPFVVLAHMNREAERTGRPHSGQFKGCDQLFSDCDVAVLLWSEDDPKGCFNTKTGTWKRQNITMTVDKNRGGFVGDETLYFDRPRMRFHGSPHGA